MRDYHRLFFPPILDWSVAIWQSRINDMNAEMERLGGDARIIIAVNNPQVAEVTSFQIQLLAKTVAAFVVHSAHYQGKDKEQRRREDHSFNLPATVRDSEAGH